MKRTVVATAAALSLLLAGCGGDDGSTTEASPSPSASPSETTASPKHEQPTQELPTEDELQAAIVTEEDLAPDYTEVPATEEDDSIEILGQTPECTERFAVIEEMGGTAAVEASAEFESQDGGASLEHSLEAYESTEQLNAELDAVESVFADCPVVVLEEEGQAFELSVEALDSPPVGDRSAAFLASADVDGVPIQLAFHFSVLGNVAQSVFQGGVGEADLELVLAVAQLGAETFGS